MAFFEDDDIALMLDDSPHSITIGGVTAKCFFDERDQIGLDGGSGGQVMRVAKARVQTSAFPVIAGAAAVVISDSDGNRNFTVWYPQLVGDGAFTDVYLREA